MRVLTIALLLSAVGVSMMAQQPPHDAEFTQQFQAGNAALSAGDNKKAFAAFSKANQLHHDACADCYLSMAIASLRMGDRKAAIQNCDRSLADPSDDATKASAHNLKGTALLSMSESEGGSLSGAESEFRMARDLDKNDPILRMHLAIALLREKKDDEAKSELTALLDLKPDAQMAEKAKMLIADPRRGREEVAPDFRVTTLQGQDVSLKGLSGKVVVMDFWATWCPPCRASVGELKELTRKYSNDKVVLISVSDDRNEDAWRDFIAKKKMDWPQFRDTDEAIIHSFGVHAFPTYIVIDGDGIVRKRISGLNPTESVVYRLKETLESMPQLKTASK